MKRKWLMIPLVTGILAAGITGATVLAHNGDGEQESPKDAVTAKVAEILGIDEQSVKDALTQAKQEVRSELLMHRLDDAVEAGRLTQEQADEYLEWYEARPEGSFPHHKGRRTFRFSFGGGGEGEEGGLRQFFSGRGFGGHRFGGEGEEGGLRERFGGRGFGGQWFGGQGQLQPGQGGQVPEGSGISY